MRKTILSPVGLAFEIRQCHIDTAVPGDKDNCVIVRALEDRFGPIIEKAVIGSNVSKIYTPGQITKFRTPSAIKKAIPVFDATKKWELPVGEYELLPYHPVKRKTGGGRKQGHGTFQGRTLPTRISNFEKSMKKQKQP